MGTGRVSFPGAQGAMLDARLDAAPTAPRAYALFAHCFTCTKQSLAAARVAAALAEEGIATLRFDFTGLGDSEGDFANTNFSSNIDDLVAAADFLRREFTAPKILVGHSLGGAAVLAAAGRIPEAVAVATIGAPSDVSHLLRRFDGKHAGHHRERRSGGATGGTPVHDSPPVHRGSRGAQAHRCHRSSRQGADGVPLAGRRRCEYRPCREDLRGREASTQLRVARSCGSPADEQG